MLGNCFRLRNDLEVGIEDPLGYFGPSKRNGTISLSIGVFFPKDIKITTHRVEFELVKILVYLGLEVGNLRGGGFGRVLKASPSPHLKHHFILSFSIRGHVAEIRLVFC